MKLSIKNRIAVYYMLATAIIIAVVFGLVYFIVQSSMYTNIDHHLSFEAAEHRGELEIIGDDLHFVNDAEWAEKEHQEAQVNPVFIQITDLHGKITDKSPNLMGQELSFSDAIISGAHFDTELNNHAIRQVQIPIEQDGIIKGWILAAVSLEPSAMVLMNLRNVLFIVYPMILLGLFFISSFLAGRSIIPIKDITETTDRITRNNLNERVTIPERKDELHQLSSSINELLQRIENAIQRERQFTSDASHELRTPLASLRGSLEVLIRKPRSQEEYEDKISQSLLEIDHLTSIMEQLLQLARLDENMSEGKLISIATLIDAILTKQGQSISEKNISVFFNTPPNLEELVPYHCAKLILDNIIVNAVKYSKPDSNLYVHVSYSNSKLRCEIKDEGIGIHQEDLDKIFNPFYRSNALSHKHITGIGLGLSIAKKAADSIQATISVKTELGKGTSFTVNF